MNICESVMLAAQGLLDHVYWQVILAINDDDPYSSFYLGEYADVERDKANLFLEMVYRSFYALTANSFAIFKKLDQATYFKYSGTLKPIYMAELGKLPLVEGTHFDGVPHPEQFRRLFVSLGFGNFKLKHALSDMREFRKAINLDNSNVDRLLGYACVVEFSAARMIFAFEDFVSKWVTQFGISHRKVEANFIHEHALLEGFEVSAQHGKAMKDLLFEVAVDAEEILAGVYCYINAHHCFLNKIWPTCSLAKNNAEYLVT